MKKEIQMVKLCPEFQREIFNRIIKKFGGKNGSLILDIPYSSLRGYKNLYFKSVSKLLIDKMIKLQIVNEKEIDKKAISVFNKQDQIKANLESGREKRATKLKDLKKNIPSLKELVSKNCLNVDRWLYKYLNLVNSGFRKVKVSEEEEFFSLKYSNFTKKGFKDFEIKIPKKFRLDEEFSYFFGLWCGDRCGGKRFGICNKNEPILNFTEEFLQKNFQEVRRDLIITKGLPNPKINYDQKYAIKNSKKGWVLAVYSSNGILSSFFYYLQDNLKEFLGRFAKKEAFFAGLFDAEGNVSIYNKSFRWACKNKKLIELYSESLKGLRLFDRYDGCCLISYNSKIFYTAILPYLKHDNKINLTHFLCRGDGNLPEEYKKLLNLINKNQNMTARRLAKALKKGKVYSELKLLSDFNFITPEGYPYRFKMTLKGIESLGD